MIYKCEKHKSNEGFLNPDTKKWECWLCWLIKSTKLTYTDYLNLNSEFIGVRENLEHIDETFEDDEYSTQVTIILNKYNISPPFYMAHLELYQYEYDENGDLIDEQQSKFECIKTSDLEVAYKQYYEWESENV